MNIEDNINSTSESQQSFYMNSTHNDVEMLEVIGQGLAHTMLSSDDFIEFSSFACNDDNMFIDDSDKPIFVEHQL